MYMTNLKISLTFHSSNFNFNNFQFVSVSISINSDYSITFNSINYPYTSNSNLFTMSDTQLYTCIYYIVHIKHYISYINDYTVRKAEQSCGRWWRWHSSHRKKSDRSFMKFYWKLIASMTRPWGGCFVNFTETTCSIFGWRKLALNGSQSSDYLTNQTTAVRCVHFSL